MAILLCLTLRHSKVKTLSQGHRSILRIVVARFLKQDRTAESCPVPPILPHSASNPGRSTCTDIPSMLLPRKCDLRLTSTSMDTSARSGVAFLFSCFFSSIATLANSLASCIVNQLVLSGGVGMVAPRLAKRYIKFRVTRSISAT
jgi:hypothetical protein